MPDVLKQLMGTGAGAEAIKRKKKKKHNTTLSASAHSVHAKKKATKQQQQLLLFRHLLSSSFHVCSAVTAQGPAVTSAGLQAAGGGTTPTLLQLQNYQLKAQ